MKAIKRSLSGLILLMLLLTSNNATATFYYNCKGQLSASITTIAGGSIKVTSSDKIGDPIGREYTSSLVEPFHCAYIENNKFGYYTIHYLHFGVRGGYGNGGGYLADVHPTDGTNRRIYSTNIIR